VTGVLLASLLLSVPGAQAADPAPEPGESPETAITWAPGTPVTFPPSGQLWLDVPLEAGRSVSLAVPKATDIDLYTRTNRPVGGQCVVAGDLTCTYLPTGTGGHLFRLTGPAGEESTPVLLDGRGETSAYPLGLTKTQRWALPANGTGWWQVEGRPANSVWAFTVPGASKLTVWEGTTKMAESTGPTVGFTALIAEPLRLAVEVERAGTQRSG
jgi:hypothetical protein